MYNQVKLQQQNRILTCWIPIDKRVKQGIRITLKGRDGWWNVLKIYSIQKPIDKINRDWKVGGLY